MAIGFVSLRELLYHPDDMPRIYARVCDGEGMEPAYRSGQVVLFSRAEPWRAGDTVAIYRNPEAVPQGENPIMLRVLSSAPSLSFFESEGRHNTGSSGAAQKSKVIVRTLNPPRSVVLNAEDVLGIHKCPGPIEDEGER